MNDGKPIIIPNDKDSDTLFRGVQDYVEQIGPAPTQDDPTGFTGALVNLAAVGYFELVNRGQIVPHPDCLTPPEPVTLTAEQLRNALGLGEN